MKKTTTTKTIRLRPKKLSISAPTDSGMGKTYESDFYKWVNTQARFLKKGEFEKLDMQNLIEQIESLGKSEKRTLTSHLEILLMHMLKVKYQPKKQTKSWDLSISASLYKAQKTLSDNPSLKPKLKEIILDAYHSARFDAALETELDVSKFPMECPWSLKEIFPDLENKYTK